jgi:hypothetical protein
VQFPITLYILCIKNTSTVKPVNNDHRWDLKKVAVVQNNSSCLMGVQTGRVNFEVALVGWDSGWSLLTGGRYSNVVVSTGLTVLFLMKVFIIISIIIASELLIGKVSLG